MPPSTFLHSLPVSTTYLSSSLKHAFRFPPSYFISKLPILESIFPSDDVLNTQRLLESLKNPNAMVTIETNSPTGSSSNSNAGTTGTLGATAATQFTRRDIPFSLLLTLLSLPASSPILQQLPPSALEFYLPQLPLLTIFPELQSLLEPAPALITTPPARGVVDAVGFWLGPRTTQSSTPLHTDPNWNVFLQLAGKKRVRLWDPEVGGELVAAVDEVTGWRWSRGGLKEKEMEGRGREVMDWAVWGNGGRDGAMKSVEKSIPIEAVREKMGRCRDEGFEVELERGDAMFIPRGWWHAVRSVREEEKSNTEMGYRSGKQSGKNREEGTSGLAQVVASVNWWFR